VIPYADVIETADRRWTARLLERLEQPGVGEEELHQLSDALAAASDPHSFLPLEDIVCDRARPASVRGAASAALRGMHHVFVDVPPGTLRCWWREGDELLRRHALLSMDGARCPEVVVEVAADARHPWQAEALGLMCCWFDRPEDEAVKIAGLSHADPRVRSAAATALLWDEPVAAEEALLAATADPSPEVATEAINTLRYYPTRRVIRRLLQLSRAGVEPARESLEEVRAELLVGLCSRGPQVAARVRRWLAPVWPLLAFTAGELSPDDDRPSAYPDPPSPSTVPLADLLALLGDPGASPLSLQERLRENGWAGYSPRQRERLRDVLLSHGDPLVRECAAGCFAAWGDAAGLVELATDANCCVRQAAIYPLGLLPPCPALADVAWDRLHRWDVGGTRASEALSTFAHHAGLAARPRLAALAGDPRRREGLRAVAVDHLACLGAAEEVRQLAGVLHEPPAVTWALHVNLLGAFDSLHLPPPDLAPLRDEDNLYLQEALAPWLG